MNCPRCGFECRENHSFCQGCGFPLYKQAAQQNAQPDPQSIPQPESNQPVPQPVPTPMPKQEQTAQAAQNMAGPQQMFGQNQPAPVQKNAPQPQKMPANQPSSNTPQAQNVQMKPQKSKGLIAGVITLAIVAFIMAILNGWQFFSGKKAMIQKDAEIIQIQQENSSLQEEVFRMDGEINDLELQVADASDAVESLIASDVNYRRICDFLSSEDAGFASSKFKASEKIVVLPMSEESKSIKITADFNKSVTISFSSEGYSANCNWKSEKFSGSSTELLVSPVSTGVTELTFSNSLDSKKFRVLVVVTE